MEETPQLPNSTASLSLAAEAAVWQGQLDSACGPQFKQLADQAVEALNKRLAPATQAVAEMMIYCWGQGYFEETDGRFKKHQDGTDDRVYYGFSRGAQVVEIPAHDDIDIDWRLVHAIDVMRPDSIPTGCGHEITMNAFLPLTNKNFMALNDAAQAFENAQQPADNLCEEVIYYGQEFSNSRNRPRYRARQTQAEQEDDSRRMISLIEHKIGDRGRGLVMGSDLAYVLNINADATMVLQPVHNLRDRPAEVTFLGVGDFKAFMQKGIATSYQHFNQDAHNGLFMAVAMSDKATNNAGLFNQALLVPLAGNFFEYKPV